MTVPARLTRFAPAAALGLALIAIPTAWAAAYTTRPSPTAAASTAHTSTERSSTGAGHPQAGGVAATRVIHLPWTGQVHTVDNAPTGLSSGDTLQAVFTLTGHRRGSADFACTAVTTHYLCSGIIRLRDGDIYVATGPVAETQPAAIEGGTRAYQGIRGQFSQQENPDGSGSWTLTFKR